MTKRPKYMPSEEEMEMRRKEALSDMLKTREENYKKTKKNITLIVIIFLIIAIAIRSFFGTLDLYMFALPVDDGRYYKVTINDKHIPVWYDEVMKIPILPFLINVCGSYSGINEANGLGSNNYYYDKVNKYVLNIESYKCYFGNYQMECKNDTHVMKKNNDTKYTWLEISNEYDEDDIKYSGKYIDDITGYINEKGNYKVEITAKHGLSKSKIYFYIVKE